MSVRKDGRQSGDWQAADYQYCPFSAAEISASLSNAICAFDGQTRLTLFRIAEIARTGRPRINDAENRALC
jgi:hypothetical protein